MACHGFVQGNLRDSLEVGSGTAAAMIVNNQWKQFRHGHGIRARAQGGLKFVESGEEIDSVTHRAIDGFRSRIEHLNSRRPAAAHGRGKDHDADIERARLICGHCPCRETGRPRSS